MVVFKDYYVDFDNCVNSVLGQDYPNTELVVVDESGDKAAFAKAKAKCGLYNNAIKIFDNDYKFNTNYSKHIGVCGELDSEYIIILPHAEVLTKNYVAEAVKCLQDAKAEMAVSELAFYFPNESIKEPYAYVGQNYMLYPKNSLASFIKGGALFWGYYYLGNKIIKKSLLCRALEQSRSSLVRDNFGCGEDILLSYLLWSGAKGVATSHAHMVLPWINEDHLYADICSGKEFLVGNKLCNSIKFILQDVKERGLRVDYIDVVKFLHSYVKRYLWRAGWSYGDKGAAIKAVLSDLLKNDNFSFDGREKSIEDNNKFIDLSSQIDLVKNRNINSDSKIRIYVSMHKNSYVAPNKYLIPIQVGTALAESEIPGILHDNVGANISEKNKRYCELTAQYWAWKNVRDADYYGFWHYRRYLAFNYDVKPDVYGNLNVEIINDNVLGQYNITEEAIAEIVPNYDIIIPTPWECNEGDGLMTVFEQWKKHLNIDDLTVTMQVIAEKYPHFIKYFNQTLFDTKAIFCNMFIMKKQYFSEYSKLCFDILEEVEKRVDHSKYNVERFRTLGHIAERLVDAYVRYALDTYRGIRILSLPSILIKNTDAPSRLNKIKTNKKNYVAVALACDDAYMPYTGALLQSIADNAGDESFYDIVIMHNSISELNQRICSGIASGKSNVSIRFFDISRNFADYAAVHVDRHLTVETYFRFMIPDIFKDYDKVLYLDCDMVVNDDLAKLFKVKIGDNYIAATRDLDFIGSCNEPGRGEFYEENILRYIDIDAPENYFQAGAILFNLTAISKKFSTKKLFDVALSREWYYHDQDVLNHLFNGKVCYLNPRWNTLSLLEKNSHRESIFKEYLYAHYSEQYYKARKNPAIIHFAGVPKPWKDINCDLADYFWKYARNCPYYERLLNISNERVTLPNGSLIFYDKMPPKSAGAPLFTIKCSSNDWTSSYTEVEFMYLTDGDVPCKTAKLNISARVVSYGNSSVNKTSRFAFEDSAEANFFRDKIGYTINEDKSITIWAKYIKMYEGFAWRVMMIESRDLEKPTIIPCERGLLYIAHKLPEGIEYGAE